MEEKMRKNVISYDLLDQIMETLLQSTTASRTTLRLDISATGVTMNEITAEAVAPGIVALKGGTEISDVRKTVKPVMHMVEHKTMLVQNDCATAIPEPPEKLMSYYGVKAQMLSPIVVDDEVQGVISVHYNDGPREWSGEDIAALELATAEVKKALELQ